MAKYRYENKYIIDRVTAECLKRQLKTLMALDSHSQSDTLSYQIRSLYFDNLDRDAYYEKVDGVEYRKKYRIRMYNQDDKSIKLECKYKDANMTGKRDCHLTKTNLNLILQGKYRQVKLNNPFFREFVYDVQTMNLKPAVLVDYDRLVYVHPASDVRITFDMNLKSGGASTDFFNTKLARIGCFENGSMVLEVKYNDYLPDVIQAVLNQYQLNLTAVSKFAECSGYQF